MGVFGCIDPELGVLLLLMKLLICELQLILSLLIEAIEGDSFDKLLGTVVWFIVELYKLEASEDSLL